jgi:hyaluronate lyase
MSAPPTPVPVVVDNPDAEFVCAWGTTATGGYGGDFRWHAAGNGSCTATWKPNLAAAATYNVYAWWRASSNRATDSPYTIYYNGGSETIRVNQEINGDQWVLLGTYPFAAGTSGYVMLSNDANEYVIADAILLEPQP